MSDDEDVEQFETADSGASTTIPMQAGNVRKGGFMVIKGRPTKVKFSVFSPPKVKHGTLRDHRTECFSSHGNLRPYRFSTEIRVDSFHCLVATDTVKLSARKVPTSHSLVSFLRLLRSQPPRQASTVMPNATSRRQISLLARRWRSWSLLHTTLRCCRNAIARVCFMQHAFYS